MTHGSQCFMLRFGKPIHFYPVTYQLTEVLFAEPLAPYHLKYQQQLNVSTNPYGRLS